MTRLVHATDAVERRIIPALTVAMAAVFGLGLGTAAVQAAGPAVQIKIATLAPDRSAWARALRLADDDIKELTQGRVDIVPYLGGIQGDEPTVVKKMRVGQLQGGAFLGRGLSVACPDALVLQLPLLFKDQEEVDYVLEKIIPYLEEEARTGGYEVVGWTTQGFNYVFSRDRVSDLASLRQAKPWLMEDDEFLRALFRYGQIPGVPAQVGDVMTGLHAGLIRTVFSPPLGLIALQWHTRVRYRLDLGMSHSFGAVVISAVAWGRLATADQQIVRAVFRKRTEEVNRLVVQQNAEALKVMSAQVSAVAPTEAAVAEFRELNRKVWQELIGKAFSAKALQRVESSLAEYRRTHTAP